VLYWRGFILEMLGKYKDALKVYDLVINLDPKNPDVWNAKGNLLSELKRTDEALICYDKALELCLDDSPDATSLNRKGNALLELGRFEEAVQCYEEALNLDDKNDIFWSNKGVALMELNKYEAAADCFKTALMINPKNDDARVLMDECLENL